MPIRVILQAISQASLLVDNEEKYVHCGRGVLVYVAFLKVDKKSSEQQQQQQPQQQHSDDEDDHTGGITDEDVAKAVRTVLDTAVFTHLSPEKMVAHAQPLSECPLVDLLIVPQASLGGHINKKGHSVQFHNLVSKDVGAALYERFCHHFRVARGVNEEGADVNGVPLSALDDGVSTTQGPKPDKWVKYNGRVLSGTFGNRQGLFFESDGPFTHTFDL